MSNNKKENNNRCFVISPIGETGSKIRKHMDMVFNSIIIPAFEDLDFKKPYRSDHDDDPGLITDKMIESITTDKLVIAVLTDLNPNVFYELGIRHSMQRPTIHLCANGTRLPFDNNDQRTIFYDIEDFYNHKEVSKKINSYVKNILKDDFVVSNPVTRYKDNLKLRESVDPKDILTLELINDISLLKNSVHSLQLQAKRSTLSPDNSPPLGEFSKLITTKKIKPLGDIRPETLKIIEQLYKSDDDDF